MIVVMDTILNIEIMHIIQLLIAIFIAICLLQSGADKIIDFQPTALNYDLDSLYRFWSKNKPDTTINSTKIKSFKSKN